MTINYNAGIWAGVVSMYVLAILGLIIIPWGPIVIITILAAMSSILLKKEGVLSK
jgi:hypothetical protein